MKTKRLFMRFILLAALAAMARAQTPAPSPPPSAAPPSAPAQMSEADLENIVGPIALYPDPLLATLLPASTYPLEIVQAARFIEDTNNISKVDSQSWDSNVKALARFPDVIKKMNDDLDWTSKLGQAFTQDQKGVMDAIQAMRNKAEQAGNLKDSPQQNIVVTNTVVTNTVEQLPVVVTNTVVQIEPAQPDVVYVPQYNPTVVYQTGPTYGETAAASIISFGAGIAAGAVIANNCNWHSGGVYVGPRGGVAWGGGYHGDVDINRNVNVNQNINRNLNQNNNVNRNVNQTANANRNLNQTANANVNRTGNLAQNSNYQGGQKWQPDASRAPSSPNFDAQSRGWNNTSASGTAAARSSGNYSGTGAARPSGNYSGGGQSAFNSGGGGSAARASSARGTASRGGGGGGGGGGRGGGGRGR